MAKRDFYDVLGVAKGADAGELKKAYRKKAMEFHPTPADNQDHAFPLVEPHSVKP